MHTSDRQAAEGLAHAACVHPITAQLLLNRGITTAAQAKRFLQPSLLSLGDPLGLVDMQRAVDRLRKAIASHDPILIFGDSDVDGITASLILYEVLRELGGKVFVKHSNRLLDGYGLSASLTQSLKDSDIRLLVLVDCGTNQAGAIEDLALWGIETIVIDHHVPLEGLRRQFLCVNPHLDRGMGRELCSAGLAFKVAQALLDTKGHHKLTRWLDVATLGLLADYSPLQAESRIIVSEGLKRVVGSHRPGLRQLCELTRTLKARCDSIIRQLVPLLNANGRLGNAEASWHLLREDLDSSMDHWMGRTQRAHQTVKQLYRQTMPEAESQVSRMHFRDHYVIVIARYGWHPGLMGILASRLAQRYGRPTLAIAFGKENEGVGSGRSALSFNLLEALVSCQQLLIRFGGHAQACGLTVHAKHLESLREAINHHAKGRLGSSGLIPQNTFDVELSLDALESSWVGELEGLAPFGPGNPRPSVVIRCLSIESSSPRKAWLTDGQTRVQARGPFKEIERGVRYDVVGNPTIEEEGIVLAISDVKVSAAP